MASHGRHGIAAIVLGSKTVKVLTHSKIPVLVIDKPRGDAMALLRMKLFRTQAVIRRDRARGVGRYVWGCLIND
jgi:Universal stress protein family